ncbi:hypothetical protein Dsin_007846 [Dipteronia sinensis]|uniref:Iron hydrogenase small subunit domain-containing protein n=1 Tax=Dipteronia sinensis TaxID=43782 RepID=A0AAE0B2A0_9ROSI|nr:hypothetical protein Dsin_007846 [Dipteronia sinensis]
MEKNLHGPVSLAMGPSNERLSYVTLKIEQQCFGTDRTSLWGVWELRWLCRVSYGVSGSSGGYAESVFRYTAEVLFGRVIEGQLNLKTIRNSDFREVTLEVEGKTVLKFAICYGFQNLQNIVRKVKMRKCDYHFVEVMACPSGCLNGGGQIKPKPGQSPKELIQLLETIYMDNVLVINPFKNTLVKSLYDEWLEQPGSEKAKKYMHTEYHPVVKSITSQLHNW